jgi:hypothetical protein
MGSSSGSEFKFLLNARQFTITPASDTHSSSEFSFMVLEYLWLYDMGELAA